MWHAGVRGAGGAYAVQTEEERAAAAAKAAADEVGCTRAGLGRREGGGGGLRMDWPGVLGKVGRTTGRGWGGARVVAAGLGWTARVCWAGAPGKVGRTTGQGGSVGRVDGPRGCERGADGG